MKKLGNSIVNIQHSNINHFSIALLFLLYFQSKSGNILITLKLIVHDSMLI